MRDGRGQLIFQTSSDVSPETSGNNVYLTIDQVIQQITSKALKEGVENAKAKGGFALVGNPTPVKYTLWPAILTTIRMMAPGSS